MLTTSSSSLFSSLLSSFYTPAAPLVEQGAFFSPISSSSPSRVETVSGWRRLAKAEESAGLSDSRNIILIKDLLCDICTIGVGRDHYERELYLYPVHPGTRECIGDTRTTFTEHKFLHLCGGCAHRRHLSSQLCMVEERYFLTNALFCPQGEAVRDLDPRSELDMQRAKKALREHIARFTKEQQARLFPSPPPSPTTTITNTTTRHKPKPVQKNHHIYQHEERRQAVAL